jgi:hypothetical protein
MQLLISTDANNDGGSNSSMMPQLVLMDVNGHRQTMAAVATPVQMMAAAVAS